MATEKVYADLSLDFTPNPITGDVSPLTNERAVKNALVNMLRTRIGSKPFFPEYGTNTERYLFEMTDPVSEAELNEEIADTIRKFEPRIQLISIETSIEENLIGIKIDYYIINVSGVQTLDTSIVTRTA